MKLLGHLSGENKFREETIEMLKAFFVIVGEQNQKTDFEKWYERIKSSVNEYRSVAERTALIVGYFSGMPGDTTFSAAQISQIFELRYPEKNERPHEPASSGALEINQLYRSTRRRKCT